MVGMYQPLTSAREKKLVRDASRQQHRALNTTELTNRQKRDLENRMVKRNMQKASKASKSKQMFVRGAIYDPEDFTNIEFKEEESSSDEEDSDDDIPEQQRVLDLPPSDSEYYQSGSEEESGEEEEQKVAEEEHPENEKSEAREEPVLESDDDDNENASCSDGSESEDDVQSIRVFEVTEETVDRVERRLGRLLRDWSDDGSNMADQKKRIRILLAKWHPDKNPKNAEIAQRVFQFIQEEVQRILAEKGMASLAEQLLAAEVDQQKVQKEQNKAAKLAFRNARLREKNKAVQQEDADSDDCPDLVDLGVGGGQVVIHEDVEAQIRIWPRSHFAMCNSPLPGEGGEAYLFGGEWYNGRTASFYSDLYKVNLALSEPGKPVHWRRLYHAGGGTLGPPPRSSHQAVSFNSALYVFGGEWMSEDQRRYRQLDDLWRFDGYRWKRIESPSGPCERSGHRCCVANGKLIVFGGFIEKKTGETIYMADVHVMDLTTHQWMSKGERLRLMGGKLKPKSRAGCLLWAEGSTVYMYGGTRPLGRHHGAAKFSVTVLEDLWALDTDTLQWRELGYEGQGPGPRSGLCQSAWGVNRRLVFGGVEDLPWETRQLKKEQGLDELNVFFSEVYSLDLRGDVPTWHCIWSPLIGGVRLADLLALPGNDDLADGGGVDILALIEDKQKKKIKAPRGRMSAQCVVVAGYLYVYGGACEAGAKKEATLDDLWRIDLQGETHNWECVQPLSEQCSQWFDDSDDEDAEVGPKWKPKDAWTMAVLGKSAATHLTVAQKAAFRGKTQKDRRKADKKNV